MLILLKIVYNFPHLYTRAHIHLCRCEKNKKNQVKLFLLIYQFIHQYLVLFKHTNILQSYLRVVYLLYGTCNINNLTSITVIYDLINTHSVF